MTDFDIKDPLIKDPSEIERLSLETIASETSNYHNFKNFSPDQQKIIQRMIHTTTCFEQIINNIYFTKGATTKIKTLLLNGASIITDTNMIKTGLNNSYTEKYGNKILCYVADEAVKNIAKSEGITRTTAAVKKALNGLENKPVILACGNAPTFLYAAIRTLVESSWDLSNIAILAMPVGFINVNESKDYTLEFMSKMGAEGIVLNGRYGGSPLVVACLHALYLLY